MISIVLPTLGERLDELDRLFQSLERQSYKNFEIILVSQGNFEKVDQLIKKYKLEVTNIKSKKKGLSYCRNLAIENIRGNIVVFSDDDAWYFEKSLDIIKENLKKNDVVCFKIKDPIRNEEYKNYKKHKLDVGKLQILKKSSIEIAVNLERVNIKLMRFDEELGLGSSINSGEENLFLMDMIKNKINIKYVPKVIVYHRKKEKLQLNKKFILEKKVVMEKIYGKFYGKIIALGLVLKNLKKFEEGKRETIKNIIEIL